ncbi:hypothetical protein PN462_02165 [Spirulina sp. CS-785/01]|nr:hypothetical protein [Spirulina sp. CS-785/01]MDB9311891.1 hypothetical protein [Spirulina sp. CS-785/01]
MSASNLNKKPYHRPELKIYGNIAQLTQASAVDGEAGDGAGMDVVPNKTN